MMVADTVGTAPIRTGGRRLWQHWFSAAMPLRTAASPDPACDRKHLALCAQSDAAAIRARISARTDDLLKLAVWSRHSGWFSDRGDRRAADALLRATSTKGFQCRILMRRAYIHSETGMA